MLMIRISACIVNGTALIYQFITLFEIVVLQLIGLNKREIVFSSSVALKTQD